MTIAAMSIPQNNEMMAVRTPPRSDASWRELLTGQRDPQHANLATRLVVGHLRQSIRMDTTALDAALHELYHYHSSCDPAERAQFLRHDSLAGQGLRPFAVQNLLLTPKEASNLIETGVFAVIAGTEEELASLPRGNWIGGTTAYLMAPRGRIARPDCLMCSVLEEGVECRIAVLTQDTLSHITDGRYETGFTYVLLPAFSDVHYSYALTAPGIPGLFEQPIFGWITGVPMSEVGERAPKVFDGRTGSAHENAAVALHVALPSAFMMTIDLVNPFVQGRGPVIVFPQTGFNAGACTINGQPRNFAEYLVEEKIDTSMPLVANYAGASINVSIRTVDAACGDVQFFAPVVTGENYRLGAPRADYTRCMTACARSLDRPECALVCRCILNHLNPNFANADTAGFVGPVTFGEIAYILVNQTLVVMNGEGRCGVQGFV
ncbi:MAG TPA: hypothetical protein VL614_28530 [Acetobacteraceae bacterium]|jgi:hypothetical protein|nr:hypothetical protein [Acetobacteraceae bacterium]